MGFLEEETELIQVFIGCVLILVGFYVHFNSVGKDLGPINLTHPFVVGSIIAFFGVVFFTRGFVQLLGEEFAIIKKAGIESAVLGIIISVGGIILALPQYAHVSLGFASVGVVGLFLFVGGLLFTLASLILGPKIRKIQKQIREEENAEF